MRNILATDQKAQTFCHEISTWRQGSACEPILTTLDLGFCFALRCRRHLGRASHPECRLSIEPTVAEIERDIHPYENKQRHISPNHPVAAVQKLVGDAENVSNLNQNHEHDAFAFGASRPDRLGDRKRPRSAEAAQHQKLQNPHFETIPSLFSGFLHDGDNRTVVGGDDIRHDISLAHGKFLGAALVHRNIVDATLAFRRMVLESEKRTSLLGGKNLHVLAEFIKRLRCGPGIPVAGQEHRLLASVLRNDATDDLRRLDALFFLEIEMGRSYPAVGELAQQKNARFLARQGLADYGKRLFAGKKRNARAPALERDSLGVGGMHPRKLPKLFRLVDSRRTLLRLAVEFLQTGKIGILALDDAGHAFVIDTLVRSFAVVDVVAHDAHFDAAVGHQPIISATAENRQHHARRKDFPVHRILLLLFSVYYTAFGQSQQEQKDATEIRRALLFVSRVLITRFRRAS